MTNENLEPENKTEQTAKETAEKTAEPKKADRPKDVPLPEPTLVSLVSGLSAQAMISMGVFPNPIDGSTHILPHQAKHLIETIAMLDEKTKGNQTDEEKKTITNVLHELRMIFVAAQKENERRASE